MSGVLQLYFDQIVMFVLVLTRVSGLVMTAPIYGARSVPIRIRAFLAIGLAVILTPLQSMEALAMPHALLDLVILLVRELIIGLGIGLAILILFSGLQLSGQIISQISGMQLADVFDPNFQSSVPVFSQLLDVLTLTVFVTVGGHRQVMRALLDSFHWRPPGENDIPVRLLDTLVAVTSESFVVGIRAIAPVMVSLILSVLILGLISRTLPQLHILAIGFNINSMVMLTSLAFSLGAIAWIVQERADVMIEVVREALIYR